MNAMHPPATSPSLLTNTPQGVKSRAAKRKLANELKLRALQAPKEGEPNVIYDKSDLEEMYELDADEDNTSDMELMKYMKGDQSMASAKNNEKHEEKKK